MKKILTLTLSILIGFLSACNRLSIDEKNAPKPDTAKSSETPHASKARQFLELDTDRNGLYDDTERMALLEVFQKECPELNALVEKKSTPVNKAASNYQEDFKVNTLDSAGVQAASKTFTTFDRNGDGKVSIKEQTCELPPLSLLLPQRIIDRDSKIPWSPDIFPEWISTAFLQEDVPVDQMAPFTARGTIPLVASQPNPNLQPHKAKNGHGVEFGANSGTYLTTEGRRDARWEYRWCLFTFRIDAASGNGPETVMVDINSGNRGGMSSPKIWYDKTTGLNIHYSGTAQSGADHRIMSTRTVFTDGQSWNVVVCGIRYGQMFASVNGLPLSTAKPQFPRYSTRAIERKSSYLGSGKRDNAAWAYDALIFGLTEPSEAMVQKMTGWAAHRLDFAQKLPDNHPYKAERPFLDAEDFPERYNHDDEKWNAWGQSTQSKAAAQVNAGGPRKVPEGFERTFYDDFRAKRVSDSACIEGDLWMGVGFNVAVGADAPLIRPEEQPAAYAHDAKNQKQNIAIVPQGHNRWRSAAIYSVNDMGYGYSWKGPKIFRIRCMFPDIPQKDLPSGLFPAFWSYGMENTQWLTSNRIEIDWFEFDGANGAWLNGLSTHYHYPYLRGAANIFAKNPNSYNRFKGYGGALDEKDSKIPGGVYMWDGHYHTWEFVVDRDMTYINITLTDKDGNERWAEIGRIPTAPTYLEAVDLQINYALKAKKGAGLPKKAERQDFFVDSVEVLQKTSDVEAIPKPFVSRPEITLSEATQGGKKVSCKPNADGITDLRYYWYADGYPLTYGTDNSYTLTGDDIGKSIRCKVKAVGALNRPEAWSNILK